MLLDRLQLSNTTASVDKLGPSALKLIGLGVQLASPWRQAAVMAAPSDLTLKWFDIAVGSFHKRQHTNANRAPIAKAMKNSDRQGTGFMGSCIRLDAGRRGTLQSVRDTVQMATRTKKHIIRQDGHCEKAVSI